ncbi:MAG: hypothetical protein KF754_04795 [Planctomycetes bacterium]|nr:hypothetical protein [Planctomycetota bacterium]
MDEINDSCPSCADNAGPAFGPSPGNPNLFMRPYTPPTADDLESSRQFYAAREARVNEQRESPRANELTGGAQFGRNLFIESAPQGAAAAVHRIISGGDTPVTPKLTSPWFEPAQAGGLVDMQGNYQIVELLDVNPPRIVVVPKSQGPRDSGAWPGRFGDDIKNCQEEWPFRVRVEHRVNFGEFTVTFESRLFEKFESADRVAKNAATTAHVETAAQAQADTVAARVQADLIAANIIATDPAKWHGDLQALVDAKLAGLVDPCPRDCPMRYSIVGWNAEIASVSATRLSTSATTRYQMVDGILDGYYKANWTVSFKVDGRYAVDVYCRFYCWGVDEF